MSMEIQNYFSEGAYDEALETSAQDILRLVSQNSTASSSCGYSSDDEASRNQEVSLGYLETRSTSSSSGPFTSFAEDLEQDIESEIDFLQEKQSLLKRAISAMKREDNYEASRARDLMQGKFERDVSSLWGEAKEIIDNLNQAENTANPSGSEAKQKTISDVGVPRPRKKQRIDTSSVACIRSVLIGDGNIETSSKRAGSPPIKLAFNKSWMGRALNRTVAKSLSGKPLEPGCYIRDWEIVDDLSLGAIVIPPPLCCLQNGVELKEAVALTSDPQLVTMSTPPFCVVHVNKAFCNLSEMHPQEIIGKPIESLLAVIQDPNTDAVKVSSTGALKGSLLGCKKPCRLQLVPVTDKFRNPRGGMSHLLVKVAAVWSHEDRFHGEIVGSLSSSKGHVMPGHPHVYGTVG